MTVLKAGEQLAEVSRLITREDIALYAEVSGDTNPLHLDDEFARTVGFDGVIAHGMFTFGHLASAVVGWSGGSENVLSLSGQFRSPVRPGDTIVAHGRVRSVEPAEGAATLDVWVTVDGTDEEPVRRGEARVRI